jgi:hypothetical protein
MRTATLVLALITICAISPALAQAPVPAAPEQQDRLPQVPAEGDAQTPDETMKRPPADAQTPSPALAPAEQPANADDQNKMPREAGEHREPAGRYTFNRVDGGLLRLDRTSGEVAFCRSNGTGWVCEVVPENRTALQTEIDRLRGEVAALKKEVASLREPPPPVPPQTVPPAPRPKGEETHIKLPTAEDIARARAFIADTWHRLVEMIENWQKDVLRKT